MRNPSPSRSSPGFFARRTTGICLAILLALLTSHCANNGNNNGNNNNTDGPPLVSPATVIHDLEVRRQMLVSINSATADRILEDASRVLQTVDRDGDVSADVLLARIGPLSAFAEPDGFINSDASFRRHCNIGGQVFVVNEINWCNGIAPNIIGCADRPGSCLMVVRITPSDEGILWAHEFGHNTGLNHRNSAFALMAPSLATANRAIDRAERDAYLNYRLLPPAGLLPAQRQYLAQTGGGVGDAPLPAVTDYVQQIFIRGVPYAEASRYTPADADTLLALLDEPAYAPYQANMISTIAAVGDPRHVGSVIRFFESGNAKLNTSEYAARRAALFGLAYFSHTGASELAMDYLIASLEPTVWQRRNLGWSLPYEMSQTRQWEQLSQLAVLATALSGTPRAREALQAMQTREAAALRLRRADGQSASLALPNELLKQALEEHARVSTLGLKAYSSQDSDTP